MGWIKGLFHAAVSFDLQVDNLKAAVRTPTRHSLPVSHLFRYPDRQESKQVIPGAGMDSSAFKGIFLPIGVLQ